MKTIIIKLLSFFKSKKVNPVVQDLLDNDHHYCKTCGDLFYYANPKKQYCSQVCKNRFNNNKYKK